MFVMLCHSEYRFYFPRLRGCANPGFRHLLMAEGRYVPALRLRPTRTALQASSSLNNGPCPNHEDAWYLDVSRGKEEWWQLCGRHIARSCKPSRQEQPAGSSGRKDPALGRVSPLSFTYMSGSRDGPCRTLRDIGESARAGAVAAPGEGSVVQHNLGQDPGCVRRH